MNTYPECLQDAWVNSKLRAGARVTVQLGDEPQVSVVDGYEIYQAHLCLPSGKMRVICDVIVSID